MIESDSGRFILQKINKNVFKKPEEIMHNIKAVTTFIENKVIKTGGDPSKEALHLKNTLDGTGFYIDDSGEYWRMYDYIEGAKTYNTIDSPEIFKKVGKAFGRFQIRLMDYKSNTLYEAIPDFHNTPKRYADFKQAVLTDKTGKLEEANRQNDHPLTKAVYRLLACENEIKMLENGKKMGFFPIRITHNDTKINNVMINQKDTDKMCIIDLDTVGPDTALADYGDAIRSGTNRAGEVAENLEDVSMDMELFKAYTEGYLDEALVFDENGDLNDNPQKGLIKSEVEALHRAPRILTLELSMRFIGDYLNGNEYFKPKPGQPEDINLRRGLVQLHLADDMANKEKEMESFIKEYIERRKNRQNI